MRQALTQPRSSAIPLSVSVGSFNRRKRNSLYVTVALLIVSLLILTVGLAATTRTQNVSVGGYYPGVILGFGSFLGIIGSNLIENKRQMLPVMVPSRECLKSGSRIITSSAQRGCHHHYLWELQCCNRRQKKPSLMREEEKASCQSLDEERNDSEQHAQPEFLVLS